MVAPEDGDPFLEARSTAWVKKKFQKKTSDKIIEKNLKIAKTNFTKKIMKKFHEKIFYKIKFLKYK